MPNIFNDDVPDSWYEEKCYDCKYKDTHACHTCDGVDKYEEIQ